MPGILTLDVAQQCGWAHIGARSAAEVATAPVTYGTIYAGDPLGVKAYSQPVKFRRFFFAMNELIVQTAPMRIYIEQAHIGRDHRAVPEMLFGLQAIAKLVSAWHDDVRIRSDVTPMEIKKFFSGYGWARKQQMVDRARLCGWEPKTEDEADALGLLCYAVSAELKVDLMVEAIGQAQRRKVDSEPAPRTPDSYFRKPAASAT